MESKTVLILGAKGMLGQELMRVFGEDARYTRLGWDREDIDVTDAASTEEKLRAVAPNILINAVAYNAVDLCETDPEEARKAHLLNTDVPGQLAQLAATMGSMFVHYSTDYVFSGTEAGGYTEGDQPEPLSYYGKTKYEGEQQVLTVSGQMYVIRLSKLFGQAASSALGKQSFFEKMLTAGKGKTEVSAVDDERSCFTYAPDLAQATRFLLEDGAKPGMYHLANSGAATWYEAAQELFRLTQPEMKVLPVSPEAFPRPAKRPRASELLNTKRPLLRDYRDALAEFVRKV